jgi:glycogen debranching enzyme
MRSDSISILDGSTFVVSGWNGDIDANPDEAQGFFFGDTRHLSHWILRVDGAALQPLSTDNVEYYFAQFFLVPSTGTVYQNPYMSLSRARMVGDGFREDLTVFNHGDKPIEPELRLTAASDFADVFEIKDALAKKGESYRRVENGELVLGYRREHFRRETRIRSSQPAEVREDGLVFRPRVAPKSEWRTTLVVAPVIDGQAIEPKHGKGNPEAKANIREDLAEWLARMPRLWSEPLIFREIYLRSILDIAALRFYPCVDILPNASVPAAGLPWFMALFGRDSLMTSYQLLPFAPELAATTLRLLAARQGKEIDDFREEQPGRILHELRCGELTAFGERPHSPYYGTSDATPLYLVLLDEYERWTGDGKLVRELEGPARAALEWIDRFGDGDGDGYVEYERTAETGLANQCWKDSWNSIVHPDGTLATLPRATCEIQGYVYDAKRRCARLARDIWNDPALGERLEKEAADLRRRFNRDFWVEGRQFFALALDGEKRRVETLTSNIGHLLWSGIVDEDKIEPIVRHLMGPQLYSGWGVRSMAEGEGPYNPIEYHNGTVWPHDSSFIAAGLARCGYRAEASVICQALFEAAIFFDNRLPEVFAGYARARTMFPVQYPTASSPQAWASGAPLLALRVMLGLEPQGERLAADPVLPEHVARLLLEDIPGRWGCATVDTGQIQPDVTQKIIQRWIAQFLAARQMIDSD